ncbi:MAG: amino acid ABC transporter permease [Paenibacillus macerans]|uniref:ABC transporter permease subunit n=1 Tax=Paenibacillus macerans TaxID=44252 RepID=A0A090ZK12_PAEMA|nr:amino acid ABC transporter permease [Paenibacillus macerans]KFN10763.1 amino ABC transporter, permease, 3-TM region, His/Glu/Gln/Arg/opine family domain protein [Paenibacillus macerans]MBS5910509.1 amino acid ABC transporter permease [Paenibacillus macerans]MCY7562466.1 amino acid ABC transporter permease [Paenibacillus macerans]MDU7477044.1 amino acid ABC transporter permease [Paenibacillus macerans]MEC0141458.1 amino acid ABC transporter permease [Paenibacillus macerans]
MERTGIELLVFSLPELGRGVWKTVLISLYTIAISIVCGLGFGALRTSRRLWLRIATRAVLELFRSVPVLVWLFFFFFGLPLFFGIDIPAFASAVLVLSLWGMTEIGEVARGALQSLPKGQLEAGQAIGLNTRQLYIYVLIPQAVRRMIPPSINVFTRIVMTSSLTVLVGVTEMIKSGQQIIERNYKYGLAAIIIYGALFALYFLICYPLSVYSRRLEKKWAE